MFERDGHGRIAGIREAAGEHLVQHDADAVEIGRLVQFEPLRLLGRKIIDASHDETGTSHRHRLLRHRARDTEIGKFDDVVLGDENVCRFDVAVQQPLAVRVREAVADLSGVVDGDRLRQFSVGGDHLAERWAVDEFHHDVVRVAFTSDVVGVDDVGMRKTGGGFGFLIEAAHEFLIGGVLLAQDFDGDAPPQQRVGSAIHGRHTALSELAIEAVAVVENVRFVDHWRRKDSCITLYVPVQRVRHFWRWARRRRRRIPRFRRRPQRRRAGFRPARNKRTTSVPLPTDS